MERFVNYLLVRAITGFSALLLTAGLVYGQNHKPSSPHSGSRPVHWRPSSGHPRPGYRPGHRRPPSVHWPVYRPGHGRPPNVYWPSYRPGYWRPSSGHPRPGYRPPILTTGRAPATAFHRHHGKRPGFIMIGGQRVPGEILPAASTEESLPAVSTEEGLPGANTGESLPATGTVESLPGGSETGLQMVRYLHVSNGTGESLRVYVQLPEEDRPRSWTLAPGEKAPLLVDGEPLATDQVQIWAESPTRRWTQYKDEALVVAAEPYQADQIDTWTEVFR